MKTREVVERDDPTRVVGRRCLGFGVDGVVVVALIAFSAYVTPGTFDVEGDCPEPVPGGEFCIQWKQDAYRIDALWSVLFLVVLVTLIVVVLAGTRWLLGASPGKSLLGIRVVDATGHPVALPRAFIRTVALGIDLIVLVLPIGLWLALFTPGHRRIGDFLAGTWVVRRDALGLPRRAVDPRDVTPAR